MDERPYGLNYESGSDAVWISREEYERLRAAEAVPRPPQSVVVASVAESNEKVRRGRRRWQVILGVLLAIGLFISVSSGSFANLYVVGAVVIFGGVSLYDYFNSRKLQTAHGMTEEKRLKHNPFKILFYVLFCVVILPPLLMLGFFILLLTLNGGDVGS